MPRVPREGARHGGRRAEMSESKDRLTWENTYVAGKQCGRAACYGGWRVAWVWPIKNEWYWIAESDEDSGIKYRTTRHLPASSMAEAEAECDAYLRQCLGLPARRRKEK
jgi:hypothetical protein